MKDNARLYNIFFDLLRVAAGTKDCLSCSPTKQEWVDLFELAKKQALVGVCYFGLKRLNNTNPVDSVNLTKALYLQWMGLSAKVQQRNETLNAQCESLLNQLSSVGIDSCVLKGQGVATMYGNLSMLRQSGDIDLYVSCGMKKTVDFVQSVSPTNEINHKHAQLHVFADTEVELHYIASELHCPWHNRHLQTFFRQYADVRSVALATGQQISIPCYEFNLVHLLAHAYRHLFGDGIGLRQMMDIYFALRSKPETCNQDAIRMALKSSGMEKFVGAVLYVMRRVFGFQDSSWLCPINVNDGEFLLSEILKAGNFGHHDDRFNRKQESRGQRFWRVTKQNCRLLVFSPWEVICTPLWRIWHFVWMRSHGYTQG